MEWMQRELAQGKEMIRKQLEKQGLFSYAFLEPQPQEASEQIRSIVVVLFPYYAGEQKGNLSVYCRGRDYHVVVPKYLKPVGEALQTILGSELSYNVYADTGPLADRYLALRAGLGFVGRNQMLIHPQYGSYFFIAYMTFNAPFEPDAAGLQEGSKEVQCLQCGRCVASCPGGALQKDGSFLAERCRSGITQKKGELEPWELAIFYQDSLIFGCDICQQVCPHNQNVPRSFIKEFTEDRIDSLTEEELEGLSRKQFLQKYPDRAFTWRGPEILRRNLKLMREKKSDA